MSLTNEADVLDVVRRLRKTIGDLDNMNYLVDKVKLLGDQILNASVEKTAAKITSASVATAILLRHVESSKTYKGIVKQYRSPNSQEDDDNGRIQED